MQTKLTQGGAGCQATPYTLDQIQPQSSVPIMQIELLSDLRIHRLLVIYISTRSCNHLCNHVSHIHTTMMKHALQVPRNKLLNCAFTCSLSDKLPMLKQRSASSNWALSPSGMSPSMMGCQRPSTLMVRALIYFFRSLMYLWI